MQRKRIDPCRVSRPVEVDGVRPRAALWPAVFSFPPVLINPMTELHCCDQPVTAAEPEEPVNVQLTLTLQLKPAMLDRCTVG